MNESAQQIAKKVTKVEAKQTTAYLSTATG